MWHCLCTITQVAPLVLAERQRMCRQVMCPVIILVTAIAGIIKPGQVYSGERLMLVKCKLQLSFAGATVADGSLCSSSRSCEELRLFVLTTALPLNTPFVISADLLFGSTDCCPIIDVITAR